MTKERLSTGTVGEDAAADSYRRRGYRVIVRNWRCSSVSSTSSLSRGETARVLRGQDAAGQRLRRRLRGRHARKRAKLRAVAQAFLMVHRRSNRARSGSTSRASRWRRAVGSAHGRASSRTPSDRRRRASSIAVDVGLAWPGSSRSRPAGGPTAERRDAHPCRRRRPPALAAARSGTRRRGPGAERRRRRAGGGSTRRTARVGGHASKSSARRAGGRRGSAARSSLRSTSAPRPSVPRCFQLIHSFNARNRRVPSNEYWYQSSGSSSGRFDA